MSEGKKPKSVLLVCRSNTVISALAAIVRQCGESALTAQNPKDAWDCIKSGAVGCVVQDITTAGTDGLALFRATRTSSFLCRIPFLFLIHNEAKWPLLDIFGAEFAPDAWLPLPCPADDFTAAFQKLLNAPLSAVPTPSAAQTAMLPSVVAPSAGINVVIDLKDSILAGSLEKFDVTKILSILEPLKLTGMLTLYDGKRLGRVYFVEGGVRHAELNEVEGADALFLLFHLKTGSFQFEVEPPTEKRTIEGNTMALLLEGLRQMDEAKALVKSFQHRNKSAAAAQ